MNKMTTVQIQNLNDIRKYRTANFAGYLLGWMLAAADHKPQVYTELMDAAKAAMDYDDANPHHTPSQRYFQGGDR